MELKALRAAAEAAAITVAAQEEAPMPVMVLPVLVEPGALVM